MKFSTLPQPVGWLELMLNLLGMINVQAGELYYGMMLDMSKRLIGGAFMISPPPPSPPPKQTNKQTKKSGQKSENTDAGEVLTSISG